MLKTLVIKSYNSRFNEETSKGIDKPCRRKGSSETELYQDYQRHAKFCGYVFANTDKYNQAFYLSL